MHRGWFKVWRKLTTSRVFANEGLLKVWIWCLAKANYKPTWETITTGRGETQVELQPGQFIFGRHTAASELRMAPGTVYGRITKLENMGNLDTQPNTHYTIITIVNWETYAGGEAADQQPTQQATNNQPTTNQQPTQHREEETKKVKKEKNKSALYSDHFLTWWKHYPRKVAKKKAATAYQHAIKAIQQEHACQPAEAHQRLLTAVQAFQTSDKGKGDPQFIPHPTTWLNEGRYDDDPTAWKQSQSSNQASQVNSGRPVRRSGRVHTRDWSQVGQARPGASGCDPETKGPGTTS